MNKLAFALTVLLLPLSALPLQAAQPVAPPVRRAPAKPAAVAPTPPQTQSAACGTAAIPCPARRVAGGTEEAYLAALASGPTGAGGDPLLDKGLMTAMSRLMAAGRCPDAAALATRSLRAELAARAQQICAAR